MEVRLTPEKEARLAELASYHGKDAVQLVEETVDRLLAEDSRFRASVQRGIDQANRGELIAEEEMDARVASWFAS